MAGAAVDRKLCEAWRWGEPGWGMAGGELEHERAEDGGGAGDAGDLAHRRIIEVPDPDGDGMVAGETDRPVVAVAGAGAGLDGAGKGEAEGRAWSEGLAAGHGIGEDIGDEVGGLWGKYLSWLGRWVVEHEARGEEGAAASEAGVGGGELDEADWGVTDGESEAVVIWRVEERSEVEARGEKLVKGWRATDLVEHLDGGDIEGIGQRLARGDGAIEEAIIILWEEGPGGGVKGSGDIWDEVGGRKAVVEGEGVGQGLEG
jgi:hypothetical protein